MNHIPFLFSEEFSARIRMECAETAFKLKIYVKKYSAALEVLQISLLFFF